MSCSITSIEQPVWARTVRSSRAERLGLALGHPRRRLVEEDDRGVLGEHAGELDDAPGAGRELAAEGVAVGAEAERVDAAPSTRSCAAASASVEAGSRSAAASGSRLARWRSSATASVSATVSEGKSRASWKERPSPAIARRWGARSVMSSPPRSTRPPWASRKPVTTSKRVVLPAPLWPMRPTTSPGSTARSTPSTATIPPKRRVTPTHSSRTPRGGAASASAAWPSTFCWRPRKTARSRSGRWVSSAVGPLKRTWPFSRKTARSASWQGDVDRLLDDDDGGAAAVDVADGVDELADDRGGEAERELVDAEQARAGGERHRQREHLLLAAAQLAGADRQPVAQPGEELEVALGRGARRRRRHRG